MILASFLNQNYKRDNFLDLKKTRKKKFTLSTSEIITLTVLFHLSAMWTSNIITYSMSQTELKEKFPNTVSYNRFVELMQSNILKPLHRFLNFLFTILYPFFWSSFLPFGLNRISRTLAQTLAPFFAVIWWDSNCVLSSLNKNSYPSLWL